MDLQGKRVIVTGGVRGLGRSLVELLLCRGAIVTVFDIDSQGLENLAEFHDAVESILCDVTDEEQVASALAIYHQKHGSAHALINNAGILFNEPLVKIDAGGVKLHNFDNWTRIISANLTSVFLMTSSVVAKMITTRTKGVIVNVSSVAAAGNAGQSAYSAAKAGVNALTATWAKELGMMGIRVVAVAPGFTETESTKTVLNESVLQDIVKRVPLRRLGKPEEIAEGIIAVMTNDFFHGKVFELDGGLII